MEGVETVAGGAQAALRRVQARRIQASPALAAVALVGLLGSELALVLVSTAHQWRVLPNGPFELGSGVGWPFAHLLAAVLPRSHAFMVHAVVGLLAIMAICYVLLLASRNVRTRWALASLAIAYLVVLLSPQLFSKDSYLYVAYARLGAAHHLNPYTATPFALHEHILNYVTWQHQLSPYGPLFTLATYPLGLLSLPSSLWLLKVGTVAAALGCLALVWKCAELLDLPPAPAALAVGLNPLFLIFGVAGSHNDLLMMLLVMAGVYLALAARGRIAAAASVASVGIKAAAAPIAPFILLISRERGEGRRAVLAAAAAGAGLLAISLAIFGPHVLGMVQQANTVGQLSVPRLLSLPFGGASSSKTCDLHPATCHTDPFILLPTAILGIVVVGLLIWALRGGDAITAAGWAALALVVTLTSIQPWYFVWVLPLAVLSRSRRLHLAAGALAAFLLLTASPITFYTAPPLIHALHVLHRLL